MTTEIGAGKTMEGTLPEYTEEIYKKLCDENFELVSMVIEECAKVADQYDVFEDVCSSDTAEGIAHAIRLLKRPIIIHERFCFDNSPVLGSKKTVRKIDDQTKIVGKILR